MQKNFSQYILKNSTSSINNVQILFQCSCVYETSFFSGRNYYCLASKTVTLN